MRPEDLDPTYVLAFLMFCAAVAAGAELSQMTKGKSKFSPDRNGLILALALGVAAFILVWWFGGDPPLPD